jgi:hypothetical protein
LFILLLICRLNERWIVSGNKKRNKKKGRARGVYTIHIDSVAAILLLLYGYKQSEWENSWERLTLMEGRKRPRILFLLFLSPDRLILFLLVALVAPPFLFFLFCCFFLDWRREQGAELLE